MNSRDFDFYITEKSISFFHKNKFDSKHEEIFKTKQEFLEYFESRKYLEITSKLNKQKNSKLIENNLDKMNGYDRLL